jgi:hypothetical protein
MSGHSIKNIKELQFGDANLYISTDASHFGGQGAGVYISTNVEVNKDLYVVGVVTATKFYGDASGLTGVATLNNTTPWRLLRVDNNQKVVDAGMFQVGPDTFAASITVDASSFTVVNTALFKSSVAIEGAGGIGIEVNSGASKFAGNVTAQADLSVNGNATIGIDSSKTHTINGEVTVKAAASSGNKFMLIKDQDDIAVAYFKRK